MIIDGHVHIKGGDVFRRELDPDRTLARMDEAEVGRSCVFSICLPSYESNQLTYAAVRGRDRLIPYAHVVPEEGVAAQLELERAVEKLRFQGLKLHVGEVRGEPTVDLFRPVLEQCASYRLPVLFDCIDRPELADACAAAMPQTAFLMAHLGSSSDQFMVDRFIDIAYRRDNVWLDTAYSNCPWKIADAVRVLGPHKLVFGSDGGGDYYPPMIELAKVRAYVQESAALERILGSNLADLLAQVRQPRPSQAG